MDMLEMMAARRAVQRRDALRTLGLGAAAVAAGATGTEAKRKKKRRKQKTPDRCPAQVAACEAALAGICQESFFRDECLAMARESCAPLATCDMSGAMDLFIFRFLTA